MNEGRLAFLSSFLCLFSFIRVLMYLKKFCLQVLCLVRNRVSFIRFHNPGNRYLVWQIWNVGILDPDHGQVLGSHKFKLIGTLICPSLFSRYGSGSRRQIFYSQAQLTWFLILNHSASFGSAPISITGDLLDPNSNLRWASRSRR